MRERKTLVDEIGARVVGVAAREDFQARKLMDSGMPFDLLLDPEDHVRRALGSAERFGLMTLLHPKGAWAYMKAVRSSARFFDITLNQATQHPGVVVLDAQLNVTWRYIGRRLGDYPDVDEVLTEARRAV